MLKNPTITAAQIAELQKVHVNTIEKRIAVLRKKAPLCEKAEPAVSGRSFGIYDKMLRGYEEVLK